MNTILWILQAILGAIMLPLGLIKTLLPLEYLNKLTWTTRSSTGLIRFIGGSEILIGLGIILPQLTGILPMLTSVAAFSLCIIMVLAIADHVKHKETNEIWKNVIIIMLAAYVAVGRFIPFQ